jgi:hypothetical protein
MSVKYKVLNHYYAFLIAREIIPSKCYIRSKLLNNLFELIDVYMTVKVLLKGKSNSILGQVCLLIRR